MDRRLQLQSLLSSILGSDNVYYQPPASVKMQYPCIVYTKRRINEIKADNADYVRQTQYTLTLIGRDPESEIVEDLLDIPYCSYDRFFTSNGLNHDVFSLYY